MTTPATIHFFRWSHNRWAECGAKGYSTSRTSAVTCKRCRRTKRFKEKVAKLTPNKSWRAGAKALTGKEPIGGTFTVTVGRCKKTFRHTQVKTAEKWAIKQWGRQAIVKVGEDIQKRKGLTARVSIKSPRISFATA